VRVRIRTIVALCVAAVCVAALAADDAVWEPFGPIELKGDTFETLKHRITVGKSGLPAQIVIKADPRDLPLEKRGGKVSDAELVALGRGPQFRSPMRLVAVVEGRRIEGWAAAPAKLKAQGKSELEYSSTVTVGPFKVELVTRYDCDGSMTCELTYTGAGGEADGLELVMELAGPVDLAWPGLPAGTKPGAVPAAQLVAALPGGSDKTVWSSAERKGGSFVPYLFFGSADRGFTWLCDSDKGWVLDPKQPAISIERDKAGQITWRVRFVNRRTKAKGKRAVKFALLTHPASPKQKSYRRRQWLAWEADGAVVKGDALGGKGPDSVDGLGRTTLAARERMKEACRKLSAENKANDTVLGGLTASALEAYASRLELSGAAAAWMASAEKDGVSLYPASMFRALAGTCKGLSVRVQPNVRKIVSPGDSPSFDRQMLGRALVHDVGVDLKGLAQPVHFVRLVNALDEFGFFEDEGTEMIPYWRNANLVRYGEAWEGENAFALTEENPAARVYVTVFRRPFERKGRKGYKAMFVVMNESDQAVRDRFYVFEPGRIFGGPNRMTAKEIVESYEFRAIPRDSDWRKGKVLARQSGRGGASFAALMDMEDKGVVLAADSKGQDAEIYGPLFVRAHNYRVLYGYWIRR